MPDIPLNREDGAAMFVTSLLAMNTAGGFYFTSYVTEADGSSVSHIWKTNVKYGRIQKKIMF